MPAAAQAATPKILFGLEYGESLRIGAECVGGSAPRNQALHLVWKSSAGAVKANAYLATSEYGTWDYCSTTGATLAAGDSLKATVGSYTRKFVMPLVTVVVDRVNDEFRGRAPAGSAFTLWYVYTGCCPDYEQHEDLVADAEGRWQFSEGGGYQLNGYSARIVWRTAKGDHVWDHDVAPAVNVTLGRSVVTGYGHPDEAVKVVLRDGMTGVRKAVARTIAPDYGEFRTLFLDDAGRPVNVSPGDRVVGTALASDMSFLVRDTTVTADVVTDVVSGKCGNGRADQVVVYRSGQWVGSSWSPDVDDQGNFSVWFGDEETLGFDPANVRHGDRIRVTCVLARGDFTTKWYTVP
jgi:hypothetical protein